MQLTNDQETAFDEFMAWFREPYSQVFRIDGCAGSGKTTLISIINEAIVNNNKHCRIAAYTGKAVNVLHKKGLEHACTIHHLIYRPYDPDKERREELIDKLHDTEDSEERLVIHEQLDALRPVSYNSFNPSAFDGDDEPRPDLIIIDESSMLSDYVLSDLKSFGIPILLVGDEFQLPPVKARQHRTDINFVLNQIVRQEEGSPIIRMAKTLRDTGRLVDGGHPDAMIIGRKSNDWMFEFDQLLCGRNRTRDQLNETSRVRRLNAQTPLPVVRDRLICLKNTGGGFYNGSLWVAADVQYIPGNASFLLKVVPSDAENGYEPIEVGLHRGSFAKNAHYSIKTFDYSDALTVHKSQGSEWRSVCVVNESDAWNRSGDENREEGEHIRWLYTAITRAKERLVVAAC